jgi:hypothetical protein
LIKGDVNALTSRFSKYFGLMKSLTCWGLCLMSAIANCSAWITRRAASGFPSRVARLAAMTSAGAYLNASTEPVVRSIQTLPQPSTVGTVV